MLSAPIDQVWNAITQKEIMKEWYFDLEEFKPEPGFTFTFTAGPDGRSYIHECTITRAEKPALLEYSWKYRGYEGESFVLFELTAEGDKTRIRLTHRGLESFPASNPDFAAKNFEGGWTALIGKRLVALFEKN